MFDLSILACRFTFTFTLAMSYLKVKGVGQSLKVTEGKMLKWSMQP